MLITALLIICLTTRADEEHEDSFLAESHVSFFMICAESDFLQFVIYRRSGQSDTKLRDEGVINAGITLRKKDEGNSDC